jgi:hypothetical protein
MNYGILLDLWQTSVVTVYGILLGQTSLVTDWICRIYPLG